MHAGPLLFLLLLCLSTFPAYAGPLEDSIDAVFNRATQARDRAIEARNAARDTRADIAEARQDMVGQVREAIDEAKDDLVADIAERREGRELWLGNDCDPASDCYQFRNNIIMLVSDLGTLSNSLFIATELDVSTDSTRLINVLNSVPGRALYPLYRAFSEELNIFESNFITRLQTIASTLEFLKEAVPSTCEVLLEDREFSADAIQETKVTAIGLELVGGIFKSIATKSVSKNGAIWGWVGGIFKNNRLMNIGIKFKTAGGTLRKYAKIASTKFLNCSLLDDNQQILASLGAFNPDTSNLDVTVSSRSSQGSVDSIQELLDSELDEKVSTRASQASVTALTAMIATLNTANLNVPVSSRASQASVNGLGASLVGLSSSVDSRSSQASVDALATTLNGLDLSSLDVAVATRASQASVDELAATLGTLNIGNLDTAVSTRASQASLDDLGDAIDNDNSMALRIQIEQQLSNNKKGISTYYLPEAYGGLLELVREVVFDTLTRNAAAGIPLRNAEQLLWDGDNAQGLNDYKKAFDKYQQAYQKVSE